jgi:hypothetical protein
VVQVRVAFPFGPLTGAPLQNLRQLQPRMAETPTLVDDDGLALAHGHDVAPRLRRNSGARSKKTTPKVASGG